MTAGNNPGMTTRRIIVRVDFGAVYSKVSWAIEGSDKQVHLIDDWPDPAAPKATREEVRSSISYNKEGEVCDWGYQVNPGVDAVKIGRFKMLVNRTNFDLHLELQTSCQDWPVRLQGSSFAVVSDYLRCIWNHTKAHISKHRGDRWESLYYPLVIFTVPGFWDTSSTQQLMKIASDAGLPLNRTFTSVPKATALALFKGVVPMEGIHSWRSNDIIIVCDTGACTMDVTSYQIVTSWPLELEEFMAGRGLQASGFLWVSQRSGSAWAQAPNYGSYSHYYKTS